LLFTEGPEGHNIDLCKQRTPPGSNKVFAYRDNGSRPHARDEHGTGLRLDWIRTIANVVEFGLGPDYKSLQNFGLGPDWD